MAIRHARGRVGFGAPALGWSSGLRRHGTPSPAAALTENIQLFWYFEILALVHGRVGLALRGSLRRFASLLLLTSLLWPLGGIAGADSPVVRAVLFYSPACGACHKVMTEDLPPLLERYGDRLQIIAVNTADLSGGALYDSTTELYDIPAERQGVPRLVVGDVVLVGALEIPEQFPALIEQYLAAGGVDWPAIPGLEEAVASVQAVQATATPAAGSAGQPTPIETATTPTPSVLLAAGDSDTWQARFQRDAVGNGLSVAVLAGMVAAVVWVVTWRPWRAWGMPGPAVRSWRDWAVPLLAVAGLAVASYLAYVEIRQVHAVCGPMGDCNSVQQSEYALLFGVIPIGVLGVAGYVAILVAWAVYRLGKGWLVRWAGMALCLMAAGGTLFSMYLTFLEPFVIGATCSWCLSSAVIMTLLLLVTAPLCRTASPRAAQATRRSARRARS